MADIKRVSDAVCRRAGIDAPAKANCEANVRKTEIVADCILDKSQAAAIRCINAKMPGAARFAASSAAPAPGAATPKDVLKKIDAAKSATDFSNISDNELKLITDDEIAKMTDVERKILAKLPASPGEATRIHNALAAAKGGKKSKAGHGGPFVEVGAGIALSTPKPGDSINPAGSLGGNEIQTGAYGVGDSPSGNYPGHRFELPLGYAIPIQDDLNVRLGLYLRRTVVQQGYENPMFDRSFPTLTQTSYMALIGIEKYFTPQFSAFADVMLGVTSNSFPDGTSGNLETSTQATQYAPLSGLEGNFLSGGIRGGVAYHFNSWLAGYGALSLIGDATKAVAKTDGGGNFEYGLFGIETTAILGLRFTLPKSE